MSVRAVAKSTRITERYLHALERSDLDALPGAVFDKGYIKAYAQFLDVDPEPLLDSYAIEARKRGVGTPEAEREKLEELARVVRARPRPRRSGPLPPPVVVASVVVIALASGAAWWVLTRQSPAPEPEMPAEESVTVTRSLTVPEEEPPPPPAPVEEPPPPPASELTISELGVGTGIVDRNLVGRSDRFPEGASVWFWTRIVGGADGDSVRHVWRHDGRVHMNARLPIGGSHWRTYSTLELPQGTAGEWTLEVVAKDGTVLAEESFSCISPQEGT